MISKQRIIFVVGVLLGAAFLSVAARSLDWAALAAALQRAHVPDLIAFVVCVFVYLVVKAHRWRYLIRPLADVSTAHLLPAVYAGNAGNLIVPHAGEFARAIVASRRLHVPSSALLASIAVEKVFDFLSLLLIAMVALVPVGRMSPDMLVASYVIGGLSAVIFAGAVAFMVWSEGCLRFVAWVLAPASSRLRDGVLRQVRAGTAGLNSIVRPARFVPVLLYSVLQWLAVIACVAFSLKAVDVPVSLAAAVSVLLLNVIGLTLPAAPGQVGTVQLAFTVSLAPFGVARADAFAASVVYNFLMIAAGFASGLPSLRRAGMELRRLLDGNDQGGGRS